MRSNLLNQRACGGAHDRFHLLGLTVFALIASAGPASALNNFKLNQPILSVGGDIGAFYAISPDSSRVVYIADPEATDNLNQIYSVRIDAPTSATVLNGPLVSGGGVSGLAITGDGSKVAYLADQDIDTVTELYVRAIDGTGSVVKVNPALVATRAITAFKLVDDNTRAVYVADQEVNDLNEMYVAPLDGSGTTTKLSGTMQASGDVQAFLLLTPDNSRVVYLADQDTDGVMEIYSRAIDGSGSAVKVNAPLVAGGSVSTSSFSITADSAYVLYRADQDSDEVVELYSRPTDGSGSAVKVNGPLVSGGDVSQSQTSPSGNHVVYVADQDTDGVNELFSRPADGSGSVSKLNPPLVSGGNVQAFKISPDGRHVVYLADQDTDGVDELYMASIDSPGTAAKISATLVANGDVSANFAIRPDSKMVVYRADQDSDAIDEIYAARLDGSFAVAKVNGPLVANGDVAFLVSLLPSGTPFSNNNRYVVYVADQDIDGVGEIYATELSVAPNVAADGMTVTLEEGKTGFNSGTFSDVNGNAVTISASIGTVAQSGTGTWTHQLTLAEGGFPIELVLDDQENLYVANVSDSVSKYDADGNLVTSWSVADAPKGICVDTVLGVLYVVASNGNRVDKFTLDGEFVATWGTPGTGDGEFDRPHGCAIDSLGSVYVSDSFNARVQVFDSSGTFLRKWGTPGSGDGEFNFNQGIRIAPSGRVYVVDRLNHRVQYFDANGTFLGKWGSGGSANGQFDEPASVGIDPGGNVSIGDLGNNRIQRFTANGTFLDELGPGTTVGNLDFPHGTAFPPAGRGVYIADYNNGRVLKFATPGSWSWSYGTTDGPDDSQDVTITATDSTGEATTLTFAIVVDNVAPTIALTGDDAVVSGEIYSLSLGAITDPGMDSVTAFRIDWGDASSGDFTGDPTGTNKTHTYLAAGDYIVTVMLTDEDGTHAGGTKSVTVDAPVPPTSSPTTIASATPSPTNTSTTAATSTPTHTPTPTPTSTATSTSQPSVTCPPVPAPCASSPKAGLSLTNSANNSRDRLRWKFTRAGLMMQADFGDPTGDAAFVLCAYDDDVLTLQAQIPPNPKFWKRYGSSGYNYKDKQGSVEGITNIRLRAGKAGKSHLEVRGKGASLPLPAPVSGTRFFNAATSVIVQLHQSSGACYATEFPSARVKANSASKVRANF